MNKFLNSIFDQLIDFRRQVHMHPELSRVEFETQKRIIDVLKQYNIPYYKAANTGVVATIKGNHDNPCVAFRADMDALPILEDTNLPFSSMNKGVMHACGHDIHMTIALGLAITCQKYKHTLQGTVKIFFQPNEEESAGSKQMIQDGCMNNPKVDYVLGNHVMPYLTVGDIEIKDGALNASTCSVVIDVFGKSTHAAYPRDGIDAIYVASKLYIKLQTLTKTQTESSNPVILSFGMIQGGTKSNIITDHVQLKGTLRTINHHTKEKTKRKIKDIAALVTAEYNTSFSVTFHDGYPPLINNNELFEISKNIAHDSDTIENVVYKEYPSMGAEDFGYYQEYAPGFFTHIGCNPKESKTVSPLHSTTFFADEKSITIGIKYHYRFIQKLMKKGSSNE